LYWQMVGLLANLGQTIRKKLKLRTNKGRVKESFSCFKFSEGSVEWSYSQVMCLGFYNF